MVRRVTACLLVALGLAFLAGCGAQSLGSLVVGIQYTGGAWPASGQSSAGRVTVFDGQGHRVDVLRVKAGKTATAELTPGRYSLGLGHGRPIAIGLDGCRPKMATVTGSHTTHYTLRLGCWPRTPKGMLDSVVAAALAQKSVHVSESFGADLYGTDHRTFDVSKDSGTELFDYYGNKMRVLLVDKTIYVRGNAWDLSGTLYGPGLGLTDAQAKRYAGKWISIPEGDKLYASLSEGLTLPSLSEEATVSRFYSFYSPYGGEKLQALRRTSLGRPRIVLRLVDPHGRDPQYPPMQMTARGSGAPLPITFYASCGMVCGTNGKFSNWNEPVEVHAPAHATPIATVRRS